MRPNTLPAGILATAGCLLLANVALAQRSVWGNPVITLGQTPYHSVSTGHGNYPGSDGFIPGYGYYPGMGPSHYPWLNGPDSPDYRRSHGRADLSQQAAPHAEALVTVLVPAEAEVWFSGSGTSQRGTVRVFITPMLPPAGSFSYEIRARWREGRIINERTRQVDVRPGDRLTVDFLSGPSEEETPILTPPRKVGEP